MNKDYCKGNVTVIIVIIILVLIIAGGIFYYFWQKGKNTITSTSTPTTTSTTSKPTEEKWVRSDKVIAQATSTDTHKLADGTYRMYSMFSGGIAYADSKDALSFEKPILTGITEDSGMMISNPSVLQISDNDWIMVYEQAPTKTPGQMQGKPGASSQRNLYLATSTDGKKFSKVGVAIDSSKEDNFFASVPDLIKLPDGKIKMYYVSGGEAIGSAISSDNGRSWTRESGYRLENNAVDPDVLVKTANGKTQYVMYYSILSGSGNKIMKSTSTDGLKWSEGTEILKVSSSSNSIIDPDVVEMGTNQYRMFFAEMAGDSTSSQPAEPNLYYADLNQSIFN